MELKDKERILLKLIKRSEHLALKDGWLKVSEVLVPLIVGGLPKKLMETMERDGTHFVRLTPTAQTVLEYL